MEHEEAALGVGAAVVEVFDGVAAASGTPGGHGVHLRTLRGRRRTRTQPLRANRLATGAAP